VIVEKSPGNTKTARDHVECHNGTDVDGRGRGLTQFGGIFFVQGAMENVKKDSCPSPCLS